MKQHAEMSRTAQCTSVQPVTPQLAPECTAACQHPRMQHDKVRPQVGMCSQRYVRNAATQTVGKRNPDRARCTTATPEHARPRRHQKGHGAKPRRQTSAAAPHPVPEGSRENSRGTASQRAWPRREPPGPQHTSLARRPPAGQHTSPASPEPNARVQIPYAARPGVPRQSMT